MIRMNRKFRLLRADEIECRVATCNKNGVSLLLYKDARCDMNILDETLGAMNWQRDHKELKGVIYAGVGVYYTDIAGNSRWIWKWDAGAESYTEKEKGEASDSFKRACVNWGIGRELYTSPFIWVKAADTKLEKDDNGKYKCKDSFFVRAIEYEDDSISYLLICNKSGVIVYQLNEPSASMTPRKKLIAYCKNNGIDMTEVAEKYELGKGSADDDYTKVLEVLKNGQ